MKEKIINDLNALFKARAEFYGFFDTHIPKIAHTTVFDFDKLKALNADNLAHLEQIYTLFYHYDYAIRKLLPKLYKAYEIDSEDLAKDF